MPETVYDHDDKRTIRVLRDTLEECRAAIWEIGGSREIVEWTGNDRFTKLYGRVVRALDEAESNGA